MRSLKHRAETPRMLPLTRGGMRSPYMLLTRGHQNWDLLPTRTGPKVHRSATSVHKLKWPVHNLDGPHQDLHRVSDQQCYATQRVIDGDTAVVDNTAVMDDTAGEELLAGFPALHTRATQQLAVLLLRHALAALLDYRTHGRSLYSSSVTLPGAASNGWSAQARAVYQVTRDRPAVSRRAR